MKIDHIALCTQDLERSRAFYETYFGGKAQPQYHNKQTGLRLYFLRFETGESMLELMTWPEVSASQLPMPHTGLLHLSFRVASLDEVDALTARLQKDGNIVISGPRVTGDGQYESCILDPDGNRVEIVG